MHKVIYLCYMMLFVLMTFTPPFESNSQRNGNIKIKIDSTAILKKLIAIPSPLDTLKMDLTKKVNLIKSKHKQSDSIIIALTVLNKKLIAENNFLKKRLLEIRNNE